MYLQWTTTKPLLVLILRRIIWQKLIIGSKSSGTSWSGQSLKCNWMMLLFLFSCNQHFLQTCFSRDYFSLHTLFSFITNLLQYKCSLSIRSKIQFTRTAYRHILVSESFPNRWIILMTFLLYKEKDKCL